MGSALLVWVGGGLLKRDLYFFGNEPSLGQNSPILHLPPEQLSGRVLSQRIVRSAVQASATASHCGGELFTYTSSSCCSY